jgi:predicted heme/steroid binding protein
MLSCRLTQLLIITSLLSLFFAAPLCATEKYAESTGRDCSACHVDPAGGGELTEAGQGYETFLMKPGSVDAEDGFSLFKLLVGYLHVLFGIFWFGTILYVHLVLKPAYASRGVPRSEVKLGLASMVIMAVTGAILTAYRVPSLEFLTTTRFGILLSIKIGLFLLMVSTGLFAVFVIGPRMRRKKAGLSVKKEGDLSLAELGRYDGQEGRPAYIAFRGMIYDVSESKLWKNGNHMGRHPSGVDLTEVLSQAPHGEDKVMAMPRVGDLLKEKEPSLTPPQKLFYFMAYTNLGLVLLIVLVLALWKWL